MEDKRIFGLTKAEIDRQIGSRDYAVDPESQYGPIKKGETLEPCIRGAQKIMNDPQKREMMYRIYRGIH